jgi:DNA repair protein RecO (recombination protein O)
VLDLMSALHDGDWDFAQAAPQSYRSQASGLVAAHLQWHLERQLRTLPLVERATSAGAKSREPTPRVESAVADDRVLPVRQDEAHGTEPGGRLVAGS